MTRATQPWSPLSLAVIARRTHGDEQKKNKKAQRFSIQSVSIFEEKSYLCFFPHRAGKKLKAYYTIL